MSRTSEVLKNRRKIERELRERKNEEIARLRKSSAFRASAFEVFKDIENILSDDTVKEVTIEIDNNNLSDFGSMLIESHELDIYDIKQLKGVPNKFTVSKKYIAI